MNRDELINNYKKIFEEDGVEAVVVRKDDYEKDIQNLLNRIKYYENTIVEIIVYIAKVKLSENSTRLPSGKISDVGYCLDALNDIEKIIHHEYKDNNMED